MVSIRALPLAAIFLALAVVHGTNSLAAGPTDQDNRPPPQSVEALAAGIEHEDPAALELSNRLWGGRGGKTMPFYFSISVSFDTARICCRIPNATARYSMR
jgi:hypothetical protein